MLAKPLARRLLAGRTASFASARTAAVFPYNENRTNNKAVRQQMRQPQYQRASFHVLSQSVVPTLVMPQPSLKHQPHVQSRRDFETEAAYHGVADATLEGLQDAVEQTLEDLPNAPEEMDISLASGVLTIYLPPHGTWVLNKQTPNQVSVVN